MTLGLPARADVCLPLSTPLRSSLSLRLHFILTFAGAGRNGVGGRLLWSGTFGGGGGGAGGVGRAGTVDALCVSLFKDSHPLVRGAALSRGRARLAVPVVALVVRLLAVGQCVLDYLAEEVAAGGAAVAWVNPLNEIIQLVNARMATAITATQSE